MIDDWSMIYDDLSMMVDGRWPIFSIIDDAVIDDHVWYTMIDDRWPMSYDNLWLPMMDNE